MNSEPPKWKKVGMKRHSKNNNKKWPAGKAGNKPWALSPKNGKKGKNKRKKQETNKK